MTPFVLGLCWVWHQAQPIAEIPFVVGPDAMFIDAEVNGAKVRFLFDTGFSGSVVVSSSLEIGPTDGTLELRDFVGTLSAKTVKIKSLVIGGKNFARPDMKAVQQSTRGMSFSYNRHVDGILGLAPFTPYVTELNFEKKVMRLYPKSVDISSRKPDGVRSFLTPLLPTGLDALAMRVEAQGGKKFVMSLDTGNSFYATTHRDSLERVGLWKVGVKAKYAHRAGVASGAVDTWFLDFKDAKIFGVPVPSSAWDVIELPSSSAESDGTVGFQFIKNFNVTYDYDRRFVWFENFSGTVGNEAVGSIGVSATYSPREKKVLVFEVSPESPAAVAGIHEGDELLSIDGRELSHETHDQLQKLLEGKVGAKVRLSINQGGVLKRIEIERARLVNAPIE